MYIMLCDICCMLYVSVYVYLYVHVCDYGNLVMEMVALVLVLVLFPQRNTFYIDNLPCLPLVVDW